MSIENEFQRGAASISQEHHSLNHSLDILSFPAIVSGHIDQERMCLALQTVVNRHPALRTRFINQNNTVIREIFKLEQLPISFSTMHVASQQSLLTTIIEYEKNERAKFPKRGYGPLFHCSFIQYGEQSYVFLLIIDHIICDAWSIILFSKELFSTYETQETSQEIIEDPYSDFVLWQKNRITKHQTEITEYWANTRNLAKIPLTPKEILNKKSQRERIKLSIENTLKLQELADHLQVSLFSLLLCAFKFLLCHLQLEDNPIRIVHSGRFRHKWKSTIGLFASSAWVSIPNDSKKPLIDFIKNTQKSLQDAIKWSYIPCEYLEKMGEMKALKIEIDYMPIEIFSHKGTELSVRTLFDESLEYLQPDLDMQLLCYHHHNQLGFYLIYKNSIANENILHHFESFLLRMIEDQNMRNT